MRGFLWNTELPPRVLLRGDLRHLRRRGNRAVRKHPNTPGAEQLPADTRRNGGLRLNTRRAGVLPPTIHRTGALPLTIRRAGALPLTIRRKDVLPLQALRAAGSPPLAPDGSQPVPLPTTVKASVPETIRDQPLPARPESARRKSVFWLALSLRGFSFWWPAAC